MTVEAKVAQILTNVTLAVTAGTGQGVKVGDIATVSSRVEVLDPDSNELLGEVSVPKVKGRVISVQPRICVVRVTDTYAAAGVSPKKYLKQLTDDPELADWKNIHLTPGDLVEIEDGEPPF